MDKAVIDRAFVRISAGLVHYRTAGKLDPDNPVPLYMAHSGPGSSLGLVPMMAELGTTRHVIAPDMMGNGDSEAPPVEKTDLRFYVECVIEILDKLGIERIDFYGQHTGAHIGCELALLYPDRVRRLILDGISVFPAALREEMLAQYAPPIQPDEYGGHMLWAWGFVRDLFLHFPYYLRDPEHRLHLSAMPSPAVRHPLVVDLLKALPTYHLAYQAAFAHPTAERLALLSQTSQISMLIMIADTDALSIYHDQIADLVPGAQHKRVRREQRAATIQTFLEF